jgi:ParB-like chromosome segregation protein Spo0J
MKATSVWQINILPQMRQTFYREEQDELSSSIALKGVLNAPIVALFTRAELEQYLSIINNLWHRTITPYGLKSCRVKGQRFWLVLLAGERRIRSYEPLVRKGVRSRLLQVVIHEHIDPFDAVDIQFSENSHRRVLPHEEAHAYAQYWALHTARGQPLNLSRFSQRIGRSAGAVRSALRFVKLPETIRHAVAGQWGDDIPNAVLFRKERLKLPYGIATGLADLAHAGKSEPELLALMVQVIITGVSVKQFRETVRRLLQNGHQDVLDLMSAAAEEETRRTFRRRTIEAGVSRLLCGEEAWLAKVLILFQTGLLGTPEAPFRVESVRRRLVRVGELYESVLELSYKRPPKVVKGRGRAVAAVKVAAAE